MEEIKRLRLSSNDFEVKNIIGQGDFGEVITEWGVAYTQGSE